MGCSLDSVGVFKGCNWTTASGEYGLSRHRVGVSYQVPERLTVGLNPTQKSAVTTLEGPLLIVAGPGSGKTRVLTQRVAALVDAGVPPWNILAVTFTNKAAAQMRERLGVLIGEDTVRKAWVATFHSTCVRLLRNYHEEAGLKRNFTIVDADEAKRLIKEVAVSNGLLTGLSATEVTQTVNAFVSAISRAKNDSLTYNELANRSTDATVTAAVWESYDRKLRTSNSLDFDDLLLRTNLLMGTSAGDLIRSRFKYLLVDEYQDTNLVQESLTYSWAGTRNVCVVGDPDQSIYAFRGATPSVMSRFSEHYSEAEVVVLDRNYRSTANVCAVSAAIIAGNPSELRAEATPNTTDDGPPVAVRSFIDSEAEARWVVGQIKNRNPLSENAVLIRTAALSRAIENQLRSEGVPYLLTGGLSFYQRAEVKDVLSWMRLSVNNRDSVAFMRASSVPKRGLGNASVTEIIRLSEEMDIGFGEACLEFSKSSSHGRKGALSFASDLQLVTSAADESVSKVLGVILGSVGLRADVSARDAKDSGSRLQQLDELMADAQVYDEDNDLVDTEGVVISTMAPADRLRTYLEHAALFSAEKDETGGQDAAQVMTIHAAKGKEFDHVYLIGVEENVIPHSRAINSGSDAEISEERRLAFVATSRARTNLSLTYCQKRFAFGSETYNEPSRFLNGLPGGSIEESAQDSFLPSASIRSSGGKSSKTTFGRVTTKPVAKSTGYTLGDKVAHRSFGAGTVTAVVGTTVEVMFEGAGRKTLESSVAPMSVVGGKSE